MDIRYDVPRKPPCLESGTYLSIYQHPSIHSRGLSSGIPTVPEYKSQDPNSIAAGLLFTFWGCMEFISVDGYGYGNYTPDGNLAEWIDRTLLGRFRDAATVQDGQVVFAPWYRYTWILSSLNFGVTVLTGLFAGYIAKDKIEEKPVFHGCPGTRMKIMDHKAEEVATEQTATVSSQLSQWPVQIKLVPVNAPYFKDANLLIAADCNSLCLWKFSSEIYQK